MAWYIAAANIGGALGLQMVMTALMMWLDSSVIKRRKGALLQEFAIKIGVSTAALDDEKYLSKIVRLQADRANPELLANRISDLCGLLRIGWSWIGLGFQVIVLTGVLWTTVSESNDYALMIWFLPMIQFVLIVGSISLSFACSILTGRYPGEAKIIRKNIAALLDDEPQAAGA